MTLVSHEKNVQNICDENHPPSLFKNSPDYPIPFGEKTGKKDLKIIFERTFKTFLIFIHNLSTFTGVASRGVASTCLACYNISLCIHRPASRHTTTPQTAPAPPTGLYHILYYLSIVFMWLMYYLYLSMYVILTGWVRGSTPYSIYGMSFAALPPTLLSIAYIDK